MISRIIQPLPYYFSWICWRPVKFCGLAFSNFRLSKTMKANVNRPLLSGLAYPKSFWRYLLLFQSWGQFQSWAFAVVVTAASVQIAMISFDLPLIPTDGLLLGVALGSLCSVIMVLPTQFTVSAANDRVLCVLAEQLYQLGYIDAQRTAKRMIFRRNLPRFLRWEEGDVTIDVLDNLAVVSGGIVILMKLQRAVLQDPHVS